MKVKAKTDWSILTNYVRNSDLVHFRVPRSSISSYFKGFGSAN